jgi:hypothetical protein
VDREAFLQKRRAKYLAQTLEQFEVEILPHLRDDVDPEPFKAKVRTKFNALAVDAIDVMNLSEDTEINGVAVAQRDRLGALRYDRTKEAK